MKLKEIFDIGINSGMEADPRGREGVKNALKKVRAKYEALPEDQKKYFDSELLTNAYGDSRILAGDPEAEIGCILAGIDMDLPELLLAKELNRDGAGIDLVLSHHPRGVALESLPQVMGLLPHVIAKVCFNLNEARVQLTPKRKEVALSVGRANYQRAVDEAELLGLNYMCMHTPCDNLLAAYLTELFAEKQPQRPGDIIELLLAEEEYATAAARRNAPVMANGDINNAVGKILVDMTGGADGPGQYYEQLPWHGVDTVVCMSISKELLEAAEKVHLNVIVAGHMASDSLGVNLFLDKLEAKGVRIIPTSGLIRVKRGQENA